MDSWQTSAALPARNAWRIQQQQPQHRIGFVSLTTAARAPLIAGQQRQQHRLGALPQRAFSATAAPAGLFGKAGSALAQVGASRAASAAVDSATATVTGTGTASSGSGGGNGSRSGGNASTSTSTATHAADKKLPRGLALLRRHPVLALTSLAITHVGIAWALVPPTYFVMHNLTPGGATSFLAGPTTAWALGLSVPAPLRATVPGFNGWAGQHIQGREPTFEDILEYMARRASKIAWRGARSGISLVNTVRGIGSDKGAAAEAQEEEEIADEAVKTLVKGSSDGAPVARKALGRLGFSSRAQDIASEIRFAQVRDAVAAYVFVKTLFPFRVPVSLFLAPKLTRAFLTLYYRRK